MLPAPPIDNATAIVISDTSGGKLSADQVDRILREENGASALIVLLRDDRVEPQDVVDAIMRQQNRLPARAARWFNALVDAVLPSV
jgi:hypothetical protein